MVHKEKWDLSGAKFDTEVKLTSKAEHSVKVNHKTNLGSIDAEIENEFKFNSDDKSMTNNFTFANQFKDFDFRH